ncbi:MAG: hypothetical protein IK006_01245 [Bacteroidaceae bacterium]|nr:hypothetical protein [Bacteroidaceae bacterium]
MKDDSDSYFDSQEFNGILRMYEDMVADGGSVYFDSADLSNLAEYYLINGETEKSDSVIEYGLSLHPGDTDILVSKAGLMISQGRIDEAKVIAESLNDPDSQELAYLRGELAIYDGNIQMSEYWFNRAVEMSDNDTGMINDIIVRYMDNRNHDICQKWLDRALILSPDSRNFIELQADLYFDTGQSDLAIEWYNHLLDEFAYDTYYWEQLGRIWYEKEDYVQALECFEFIEAIDPEYKPALMMKASCLYDMEDWEKAFDIYNNLLVSDSDSYTLLYYCGRCLYETGCYDDAMNYLSDALNMLKLDNEVTKEMYVELFSVMANCALKKDDISHAKIYLHEGLAIDPDDEDLKKLAAILLPDEDVGLITGNSTQ